MIEITREIAGAPDYEVGKPRTAGLAYDITWPQEGEAPGLALVISGFGDDTASDYSAGLRRHIVETTGMGAVSVRYHAFHARPTNGGAISIDPSEQAYLIGAAILAKAQVRNITDFREVVQALAAAKANVAPKVWIDPAHGERQNFGLIQALDHLLVIGDLMENAPPFDAGRIVALGSSHGAYIAHLMAKIAPSTLAAIIDNSAYAQPPMNFLAMGDLPEITIGYEGLNLHARTRSAWTLSDRNAPDFYSRDRDLIRDLRYPPHIAAQRAAAEDAGTQYFMVNAAWDPVSPPEVKQRQQAALARAGFAAELDIIGEDRIDGRLFKTVSHGLGCSLKGLFDRYIGRVRNREVSPDAVQATMTDYACVDRGYRFRHSPVAPYVTCEVYDLFEDAVVQAGSAAAA
ncbi:MAG: DUF2920 family protein [Phenylobacterium sp.]|uniref:DUF2920 family protein n=1 Tax=Phenylobacterium sp. TaxID=1871053 RepID=UPI001A3F83AE|nr:DUF2920 family protein [Phenylobacterium sp.]MBL8554371.1 DUF2920 family protein [Phenylobacterium sp.]